MKKFRGCEKPTEYVQYTVDNKPIYRCVAKYILPEVRTYIQFHSYFKKGFLPFPGSIMEQPTMLLQIFDILDGKISEMNSRKQQKGI